ncbi:MAG: DUF6159 family protein, partial [Acidimicrobiia bacterium]|nr:DUF6159 family protein [Acidimicrobiia bacterium]
KSSWSVLKADKELIALPAISGVASIIVAATFIVPLFATQDLNADESPGVLTYIVLFAMYVALAYVTIFFNAALISAAHERLNGGDPTIRSAVAGARSRAGKILPWAIVSATVSIILRAIEERAGTLGRIVAGLAGVAWAVVTFLVLPIIVIEGLSVGDAIKKSGNMFKQTWGENLAAQVGFGLIGFVAVLPAVLVAFLGISAGGAGAVVAIAIAVLWVILVTLVISALSGVFQTALYHYAVDGEVPSGYFSNDALSASFAQKHRRSGGFGGGIVGG